MEFDYIIVGAGSAGCILADRLSESGEHSVLLVEAGGADSSFWFKVPVGFTKTYYNPQYNWMYYSEPKAQLNGRRPYCPRGKVQGGSGSINAMIYVRGQPHDFDDWARAGNPGWSFRDVLPYFRRLESHWAGDTAYHGANGKIAVTSMRDGAHAICGNFIEGAHQAGFPVTGDINGADYEGATIYDVNARNGQRSSSSFEYLHPALGRANLRVERNVTVGRVVFNGRRAIGLLGTRNGESLQFRARREVTLSAGAVDTPKLMQLSGLGDPDLLAKHGIALVHALPAVGKNLQDHLCVSFYYRATVKTLNDELGLLIGKVRAGLRYLTSRKGPLSMSVNQSGGFFKGDAAEAEPNLQLYFNPLSYRIPKSSKAQLEPEPYSGFLLCFNPCRPTSHGSVEIASGRVEDAAKIRINALTTDKNLREVVQGSRLIRRIMASPALSGITAEEISPGPQVQSDEALLDYFRDQSGSIYHLCGSCAMGPDAASAVVDASVFPNITSGNLNAPTMMVAEKGADMILEDAATHPASTPTSAELAAAV